MSDRELIGGRLTVKVDDGLMVVVESERFAHMVSEAHDGLPPKLGRVMRNVAVTVDQDSTALGLLGLYEGVPLTARTSHYSAVMPDRITISRHAICAICQSEEEVVEQVRRTVIHEVAHHISGTAPALALVFLPVEARQRLHNHHTSDQSDIDRDGGPSIGM